MYGCFLVRLVGGVVPHEGRVEILHEGRWGTVCDDYWDTVDATVVCGSLGYASGLAVRSIDYGEGEGVIWLDNVECIGTESRLEDCPAAKWGVSDCSHGEDAGAVCS